MLTLGVRIGGSLASAGVLLSLLAGAGRTTLAMARDRELPGALAAVHQRYQVPARAESLLGSLVTGIVLVAERRAAIGASSFAVLVYYGVANASALTLDGPQRRWLRPVAAFGLLGCPTLAFTLPGRTILVAGSVLAAGLLGRALLDNAVLGRSALTVVETTRWVMAS